MKTLYSVQILRALAASLVVIDHLIIEVGKTWPLAVPAQAAWVLGAFGVDVFFVISGFIMYTIGAPRFGSKRSAVGFILDRTVRIVPLYWIALAAWLLVSPVAFSPPHILTSFVFLPYDTGGEEAFPVLSVGWTLQFEVFFYAVFAATLFFDKRTGTILAIGALLLCIAAHKFLFDRLSLFVPWYLTKPIIGFFIVGIVMAILREWLKSRYRLVPIRGKAAAICAVTVVYGAFVIFAPYRMHQSAMGDALYKVLAILLVGFAVLTEDGPTLSVVKKISKVGDWSYCLYLFHVTTIFLVLYLVELFLPKGVQGWLAMTVAGLSCFAVSAIAYTLLDRPLTRRLKLSGRDAADPRRVVLMGGSRP